MSTRIYNGDSREAHGDGLHAPQAAEPAADHSLLAEDPLTGLPWTETLLPLVMNWGASAAVHAVCLHFVGLGVLANLPEFQSSHSLLREATDRLSPLMGEDDRLTRFSGNKFLIFSKRSEATVRRLLVDAADRLESLGTEVEGRHLPEIRVGLAMTGGHGPGSVTVDAMNTLMSDAAGMTVPMAEVVAPRDREETEAEPAYDPAADIPLPVELTPAPQPSLEISAAAPGLPAAPVLPVVPAPTRESDEGMETTMITRGHHERTPIRPVMDTPPPAAAPRGPDGARLVLKGVNVVVTGLVATAIVELDFEGRRVRGKAIGRSAEGHEFALVAEALARAVTDLLPAGHGMVFRQAVPTSTDAGEVVVTVVEFLTPDRTEFVFGVAPTEGEPVAGVARSVLNAVNHSTAGLLEASA